MWTCIYNTYGVFQKATACRCLGQTKKGCETLVLALSVFVGVYRLDSDRNSEGADEDLTGKTAYLLVGLTGKTGEHAVVAAPRSGVVKGIPAHQKDPGELFVVVSHHSRAGCFLRHSEKIVYILDRAERLLP